MPRPGPAALQAGGGPGPEPGVPPAGAFRLLSP
ncbi:hypothetical protein L1I79_01045 [Strepomyces sp. STD 3.1]|nr:hypothetical protein [Streptomyces sp. STD 3.1]